MVFFKPQALEIYAALTGLDHEAIEKLLSIPPDFSKGHFALPLFQLAKERKTNPKALAEECALKFTADTVFSKAEAANGYLNLFVHTQAIVHTILHEISTKKLSFGHAPANGKRICIDFSSPNIGKQLAFHHLRSTMIGNCLSKAYAAAGWKVERINHLGDWGTQFGKLIVMYLRTGLSTDPEALSKLSLPYLNALYVDFGKVAKEDPSLEDQAREAFAQLEQGNPLHLALWEGFKEVTLKELRALYQLMGVEFDHWNGEAFFNSHMPAVIELLESQNLLANSQDLDVVHLDDVGIKEPCLIRKSDGASLYATRDLAAALYRQNTYQFDRCLYVVDQGQGLHFKQVFAVLKKCGFSWAQEMHHIPFGLILQWNEAEGKWSKGSSKQGNSSTLREVFEAAQSKIIALIDQKNPDLENKADIAMQIGVSALTFNDLKNKRQGDIKFDWDAALSFEGDTGPYVQNAHVRLCSILRKAEHVPQLEDAHFAELMDDYSLGLILTLAKLPERIQAVTRSNEGCELAQYALEIAESAHRFVHHNRVLGSPEEKSRLFLVWCTQQVLENTLSLLGLSPIRHM
jgi:arginyl-tRNA synthetase